MIIGTTLAKIYGWRLGEQIPLRSSIWSDRNGNNTFFVNIDGIFSTQQHRYDNELLMHYSYLNDTRPAGKDTTTFFILKIANRHDATRIAQSVDALFANSPDQTRTATASAFAQNSVGQFGNIGSIVTAVVGAVLFTMLLVTANTMA